MKENRKDQYKRNMLSEVLPLLTPYKINIDVSSVCNFKCIFCFHAIDDKELKNSGFKPQIMDFELFKTILKQIKEFPEKIKCIGLAGIGEPLINKKLPDMIRMTKEYDVSEKIVITTNGSLLKPKIADALVDAGLDEIIISIEALNSKKYYDISKAKIIFQELLDNIEYLYKNRGQCKVFVKIVSMAFEEKNDEKLFHELFDEISDMAYVEEIIPQFKPVDYDSMDLNYEQTIYGKKVLPIEVCSMIFYAMQIAANGNVCPCCVDYNETEIFGNANTDSLYNIWNSIQFNRFRKIHLNNKRNEITLCQNCEYLVYNIRDEDILDGSEKEILDRI